MTSRGNSELQLLEVSTRACRLTHMINSWFKVANLDGGSKYISNGLLRDALDLQESLNMSGKLRSTKVISHMKVNKRELMEGAVMQEEKPCSSHSWRSCSEELKILLQYSNDDEKEKASSSSRSLEFYGRSGLNSSCCLEEGKRKRPAKMKAPSLIARLMGLEEVPAEAAESIGKEQNRENLNAPRSMFHVEMPEARRLPLLEQIPKPERVTLRSIIEREKMEQLMKRSQELGCGNQSDSSVASASEKQQDSKIFHMDEDAPSFAKAMQLPSWERGEQQEDLASCKTSSQEAVRSAKMEHEEVIANSRGKLAYESVKKDSMSLKKSKYELSKKSKMPASACHGQQKKEAVKSLKRMNEGLKPELNRMNPQSKTDVKVAATPSSQAKKGTTASTEPAKRPATAKRIVKKAGAPQQNSMIPQRKLVARNSTNPAAKKKTDGAKPAQKTTKLKTTKQKDGKEISPFCKIDDASVINIWPAAEPPKRKKLRPKSSNDEQTRKDQKTICEAMRKPSKSGASSAKAEATAAKHVDNELSTTKRTNKVEHVEGLLLSSQSFLLHAYELSLDVHTPIHHEKIHSSEVDHDAKLYLDCAEELILHKRCNLELSGRPMLLNYSWRLLEHASLDQIVGEISEGVRRLANYIEIDDDVTSRDSLYVRLERDLKCKDMMLNAMWDVGWRNGICMEEADHVVGQVEEQMMSAIIEEIVMELVK